MLVGIVVSPQNPVGRSSTGIRSVFQAEPAEGTRRWVSLIAGSGIPKRPRSRGNRAALHRVRCRGFSDGRQNLARRPGMVSSRVWHLSATPVGQGRVLGEDISGEGNRG